MKTRSGSLGDILGEPPEEENRVASPDRPGRRGSLLAVVAGLSLLLIGVGAFLLSLAFDERPTVSLIGSDAPVNLSARSTEDISAHNSPTLVRNPARPSNLAVSSRIDTPAFSCALHVSFNGGASWSQTPIPAPKGEEPKCFAPDVAFSRDGTLYLLFSTLAGRGNAPHALWVSRSSDGGRTLSEPVKVRGPLAFHARLAPDPVKPGRVFLTWLQAKAVGTLKFVAPGNRIVAARSDDGGATWLRPINLSSPARGRVITPAPVVGPDGTLYVLYVDLGEDRLNYEGGHGGLGTGPAYPGRYTLVLARSLDGRTGWQESVVDDRLRALSRFVVFLAPAPSVAVDRSGRVYAAFHDTRLGDADVWLWSLENGTSSWDGPTRVNDTERRDGTAQYLPKLAVAPGGRLDVLYYDRRADRRNLMNHSSFQSSFDNGKTFTPALRLSSRPSDSRIGFAAKEGFPDLGSRLGLISSDRAALAIWTDTRAGVPETQKQDLAEAAVAVSDPPRLPDAAVNLLRFGGLVVGLSGLGLLTLALRSRRRAATAAGPEESGVKRRWLHAREGAATAAAQDEPAGEVTPPGEVEPAGEDEPVAKRRRLRRRQGAATAVVEDEPAGVLVPAGVVPDGEVIPDGEVVPAGEDAPVAKRRALRRRGGAATAVVEDEPAGEAVAAGEVEPAGEDEPVAKRRGLRRRDKG